jgi:D-serine deaminase-like pyridoxal phosphate-dependent protein
MSGPEGIARLPTPCLLIEQARLERNLRDMQERARLHGAALRPHIKTHKCLDIARLQLDLGAVGVTSAKPEEAAVFVEDRVPSLTLAFPVVDPARLAPLLRLAAEHGTRIRTIVDSAAGVLALDRAASEAGTTLEVLLKVDVGLGRVGVDPDASEAVEIPRKVLEAGRLRLAGLLAHAGHAYAAGDPAGVRRVAIDERHRLAGLVRRLAAAGIAVDEVSTGCTPTALVDAPLPPIEGARVTEMRPGNYAFLDLTAVRLGLVGPERLALGVLVTVVSARGDRAVIDAGSKTLSSDRGPHGTGEGEGYGLAVAPQAFLDLEAGEGFAFPVERLSEEHGLLRTDGRTLALGTRLVVLPNHACVAANLARDYVVVRKGRPVARWPVHARAMVH